MGMIVNMHGILYMHMLFITLGFQPIWSLPVFREPGARSRCLARQSESDQALPGNFRNLLRDKINIVESAEVLRDRKDVLKKDFFIYIFLFL